MLSQEIRRNFLEYFKKEHHTVVPSAPVFPHDDPTLLFVNAGMNQFKDVFLGKSKRDYTRATSSQKCIRVGGKHNDLDNVGHTSRHHTFFEMLGSFSFGDYFKAEAIRFAWDVTLNVFKLPEERIWVSVFENDEESFELWKAYLPKHRIIRFGEKENFWSMGDTGPCGPCSELLFDRGEAFGEAKNPYEDLEEERYLEFWNLVFMQYNREKNGTLTELPNKSIDTGAGLERIVMLKTGVPTVFETDILRELISQVESISGKSYDPKDRHSAPAFHVVADHLRALSFAIADGAQPSNVERGYVLRKILRRAVRYGRLLGLEDPFLAKIFPRLLKTMGADYPELKSAESRIVEILTLEEESFIRTLKRGGNILNAVIAKASKNPRKQISGEDAFKLKDTYGFPVEEILLIAKDLELTVNLDAFELLEERAKELSRSSRDVESQEVKESLFKNYTEKHGECAFIGYDIDKANATIMAIVKEGKFVDKLEKGEEGSVLLDKTPFYAEMGGQVGDTGELIHKKADFIVADCKSPFPDVIVHKGLLTRGVLIVGEPVEAVVNSERRQQIASHHTATHLLHWALGEVLGEHIKQCGSLVEASRLRFDFTHHKGLSLEEIRQIETLVNAKIRSSETIKTYQLPYEKVQTRMDIKQFFGEKYDKEVRVIDIDDFSKELCGGVHVKRLGSIGLFRIIKEGSIAAGIRRIEAVVGKNAEEFMYASENLLRNFATFLQTKLDKLPEKISQLIEDNKKCKSQLKEMRKKMLQTLASDLLGEVKKIKEIPVLTASVDINPDELAILGNDLMGRMQSGVLLLALSYEGRAQLLLKISDNLLKENFDAGILIKDIAPIIGGSGGGKKGAAQAGGKSPEKIQEAFKKLYNLIEEKC